MRSQEVASPVVHARRRQLPRRRQAIERLNRRQTRAGPDVLGLHSNAHATGEAWLDGIARPPLRDTANEAAVH
jgi:hypothetical protein